jgi:alpha/beta superfamily hydrolase
MKQISSARAWNSGFLTLLPSFWLFAFPHTGLSAVVIAAADPAFNISRRVTFFIKFSFRAENFLSQRPCAALFVAARKAEYQPLAQKFLLADRVQQRLDGIIKRAQHFHHSQLARMALIRDEA